MTDRAPMQMLEAYKTAVYERDAEAFLSLYSTQARVFDTWAVWVYEDTASRRQEIENWFSSLAQERVMVSFEDVHITTSQELAILTATGRFAALGVDGTESRAMQNRLTWALKKEHDRWLIVHEHTSAPIGFTDLKGILQRSEA